MIDVHGRWCRPLHLDLKKTAARWRSVLPGWLALLAFLAGWVGGGAQVGGEGEGAAERKLLNVSQLEGDGLGKHETRLDWPTPWWEEQMWWKRREVLKHADTMHTCETTATDYRYPSTSLSVDTQSNTSQHLRDTTTHFILSVWVFELNYFFLSFIHYFW